MFLFLRVNDGINFRNSKHPFWRTNICWKPNINNRLAELNHGQELVFCFITCKQGHETGRIVGFATYVDHHDMREGPIKESHRISNKDQGWDYPNEKGISDLHLDYKDLHRIKSKHFPVSIQGAMNMILYEPKHKERMGDLVTFYKECILGVSSVPSVPIQCDLKERRRKIEEEYRQKLKELDRLEKEQEFERWIHGEGFQYYLKRQLEDIEKVKQYIVTHQLVCQITYEKPTRESWNALTKEEKRTWYPN